MSGQPSDLNPCPEDQLVYLEDVYDALAQGCGHPGCTYDHSTLYLTPLCHPGARVKVSITRGQTYFTVACAECEAIIAQIQVASRISGN